jgi:hypothetical protein
VPTPRIRVRTKEGRIISNAEDAAGERAAAERASDRPISGVLQRPRTIFPYGVSRNYLEQAIRDLELPIRIVNNPEGAEMVITLKNYYRRRPDTIRQAEAGGVPIHILKSNTVTQVKEALVRVFGAERPDASTSRALIETMEAIRRVKATIQPVELGPQNAYVRRLQHQLVTENELVARSTGKEPQRRLRIFPSPELVD